MSNSNQHRSQRIWLAFISVFCLTLALVTVISLVAPASAARPFAPPPQAATPVPTEPGAVAPTEVASPPAASDQVAQPTQGAFPAYAGSSACEKCHTDIHTQWVTTRHANAFSTPIFQKDWGDQKQEASCLACHTTGYNPETHTYAEAGVTCEACHGPFQTDHPAKAMPVTPNASLCGSCHKTTTDEWHASKHAVANIQCPSCHNPHSQTPLAATVTDLCTNCHKDRGTSFTHSTHASAGLECSNCHMYTAPRTNDPIGGLAPTGHTFSVGSDACIGCHQDTVHTRDTLVQLSGQVQAATTTNIQDLEQQISQQQQTISNLQTTASVRLYSGLIQGAIVGLVTGGAAAWVVSRRIHLVEEEDENG